MLAVAALLLSAHTARRNAHGVVDAERISGLAPAKTKTMFGGESRQKGEVP
jgi:hypothetical protein